MIETTLSFFAILIIVVLSVIICAGATLVVRSVYDDWDEWIVEKRQKQRKAEIESRATSELHNHDHAQT